MYLTYWCCIGLVGNGGVWIRRASTVVGINVDIAATPPPPIETVSQSLSMLPAMLCDNSFGNPNFYTGDAEPQVKYACISERGHVYDSLEAHQHSHVRSPTPKRYVNYWCLRGGQETSFGNFEAIENEESSGSDVSDIFDLSDAASKFSEVSMGASDTSSYASWEMFSEVSDVSDSDTDLWFDTETDVSSDVSSDASSVSSDSDSAPGVEV
ncbi:hypothetical protein B0H13DRAFT_1851596 [Mycena leptocephala]|nr:hypothetical protein B0H13DRAFT_1851596 [Mycena leptocephala]